MQYFNCQVKGMCQYVWLAKSMMFGSSFTYVFLQSKHNVGE